MSTDAQPASPTERIHRLPERGSDDRAKLDAFLDSQLVTTLSTVTGDGEPWVVPLLFARDGDRILVHGSTGAGALRAAASGAPVALSFVSLDALVVGHTTFESSANYRSAVLRGRLEPLPDDDRDAALNVLSDRLIPGRVAEVRPSTRKELAMTQVLALPITPGSWTYKERTGPASEPDEPTDAWCGIVPRLTSWGTPEASSWTTSAVPASVRRLVDPSTD